MTPIPTRLFLPRRNQWTIATLLDLLSSEQLTCVQLARFCHATAQAGDGIWQLQAFSRIANWQDIHDKAQEADERRKLGQSKSLLDGIPISTKANIALSDQPLTAGSKILGEASTKPMPTVGYNAELVQHLMEDCGAICIGVTNMDEFGMGSLGTNTPTSATRNPWDFVANIDGNLTLDLPGLLQQSPEQIFEAHEQFSKKSNAPQSNHSAGGSSCGAAVSVAHGSSLIGLASDTGGSIRLPAAWCGTVGLKPSYGRNSRHGLVAYASSLDTIGFLAPTAQCASLVWEQLSQTQLKQQRQTPMDATSHVYSEQQSNVKPIAIENESGTPLKDITIGIPAAFSVEECPELVKGLWSQGAQRLERMGATTVILDETVIRPSLMQQSLAAYYVLACAEASSNLARYDGFRYGVAAELADDDMTIEKEGELLKRQYSSTRTRGFGMEVIRRVLCGTAVLSSDKFHSHYEAAAKLRAAVTQELHTALSKHVDFLLIPTVVSPPPEISSSDIGAHTIDSTEMFANDIMTVPISLAGLTAVNVIINGKKTNPVEQVTGLQLVGPRLEEEALLLVAQYLEHQQ